MTTLDQAHAIVARQGWLSFPPPPFRQKVLERCRLAENLSRAPRSIRSAIRPAACMASFPASSRFRSRRGSAAPISGISRNPAHGSARPPRSPSSPGGSASSATRETEVLHLPLHRDPRDRRRRPRRLAMVRPRLDRPYRHRGRRRRRPFDPRSRQTLRRGAAAPRRLPLRDAPRRRDDRNRRQPGRPRRDDESGAHDRGRAAAKVANRRPSRGRLPQHPSPRAGSFAGNANGLSGGSRILGQRIVNACVIRKQSNRRNSDCQVDSRESRSICDVRIVPDDCLWHKAAVYGPSALQSRDAVNAKGTSVNGTLGVTR